MPFERSEGRVETLYSWKVPQKVNRLVREVRVKPCGKSARQLEVIPIGGKPHALQCHAVRVLPKGE